MPFIKTAASQPTFFSDSVCPGVDLRPVRQNRWNVAGLAAQDITLLGGQDFPSRKHEDIC